jgi:hypothetical protein
MGRARITTELGYNCQMYRRLLQLMALGALTYLTLVVAMPPLAAQAHSGSSPDAELFRSRITAITPAVSGLVVVVGETGESVTLTNSTGGVVEVPGYSGEPYLRFDGHQVSENANSLSAALNGNQVIDALPTQQAGGAQAPPVWKVVAQGNTFTWHDHRIHWMTQQRPPKVAADPGKAQRVLTWRIPVTAAGSPVVIDGELLWIGESGASTTLTVVALAVTGLVVVGLVWARRRARTTATTDDDPDPATLQSASQ